MTPDAAIREALAVAGYLTQHGLPVFTAKPAMVNGVWDPAGGHGDTGYWLPTGWEQTKPDPTVVDRWRPGQALCALMGHVVDGLDVDPRHGGDATKAGLQEAGIWPRSYGTAATPSGGIHELVAPLGVHSMDDAADGLDVKAGANGAGGHGFLFIAPTVKLNKVTGEIGQYRWIIRPDLDALGEGDDSGQAIAEMIRAKRNGHKKDGDQDAEAPRDWMVAERIPQGKRYPWLRSYAGWLREKNVRHSEAVVKMRERWEACDQPPDAIYPMPWDDAKKLLDDIYDRYEAGPEATVRDDEPAGNGLPPLVSLDEFLATPDEEITYRVDKLWPTGGRIILAAGWKAGKTTLNGNLTRSLVDDQPFLGRYAVQPVQRLVIIDNELDKRTLRRWLREQGIVDTKRVDLVSLRGKVSTFDILKPAIRAQWAKHIGPADVLLFDCLRPVLDALNLKEATEAGRFLVAFDALLDEAGIPEAGIAHHMGHAGERSRGDSRLRDWPDAEWKLVRGKGKDDDEADPAAPRYFSAYGRDVDEAEQLLGYDPATRRLTIEGGSRKHAETQAALADILPMLTEHPDGRSGRQIEDALCGEDGRHIQKAVRAALKAGRTAGFINVTPGPRNAHIHHLTPLGAQEIAL